MNNENYNKIGEKRRKISDNTLNRDEDDSRESCADSIHSLAEIVTFVRLLNVVDRQGTVLHANVRIAQFQVGVIARRIPCETKKRVKRRFFRG